MRAMHGENGDVQPRECHRGRGWRQCGARPAGPRPRRARAWLCALRSRVARVGGEEVHRADHHLFAACTSYHPGHARHRPCTERQRGGLPLQARGNYRSQQCHRDQEATQATAREDERCGGSHAAPATVCGVIQLLCAARALHDP
eukprot:Mycagemm_TRINITY_DN10169_c1_g2::TRINITY_DN10169_c1_g2_i1::g.5236::m.5236 type:complete len:145 gc:universal TRINITY_DN10169_c1_g2_i1:394-828(+)